MSRFKCRTFGSATLYRGDALEIMTTLAAGSFAAVITDPPYSSGGNQRDKSAPTSSKYQSSAHRGLYPEFAGDARDQRSYLAWSTLWMARARELVRDGGLCLAFSDWRQLPVTSDALQCGGWVWRGITVWDKTEASRPQLGRYRHQTEFGLWGTKGARPAVGKTAPGVFRMPVPRIKHHIAGKPVELMSGLLTIVDGAVLDPFMGSGTVGLACAQRGLPYVGIEMEPAYYKISCQRLGEAINGGGD